MALALADVLPDFSARGNAPARTAGPALPDEDDIRQPPPPPAEPDPELLRAAIGEAEEALAGRLSQEHAHAMAAMAEEHAAELGQLRSRLGAEAAAAFVARLDAIEAELVAVTSSAVARILGGVLSDEVKDRSVAALTSSVNAMLTDREACRIVVRAPASLREAVGSALGARAERAEFIETDGLDLSIAIDETVMETRMAEWSAALREVIA